LINTIPMDEMKINETVSAIQKLTSQLARIEILLTEAQQKKTDIEAKNAVVIGLRDKASIPRQAWCVAYYDQLSGEVDTIEIDDQSDEILVAAEGATTDEGQLSICYWAALPRLSGILQCFREFRRGNLAIN